MIGRQRSKKNKGKYNHKGGKRNMSRRWIEFPEAIKFYNPSTKEPIMVKQEDGSEKQDDLDFKDFMDAMMANPVWNEGYAQASAQESIMSDFEEAWEKEPGFWVADEDFKFLETCAKTPQQVIIVGSQAMTVKGFGRHPSMARQYVRMQEAIVRAKTEAEKKADDKKHEEEAKKKADGETKKVEEVASA
jgi:hypothetical protein